MLLSMKLPLLTLLAVATTGVASMGLPQKPFSIGQFEPLTNLTQPSTPDSNGKYSTGLASASGANSSLDVPLKIDGILSSTYDKSLWITDTTCLYANTSLQFVPLANRSKTAPAPNVIPSPNQRLQRFYGWGVAITDSTSVVLQSVRENNETFYWEILRLLFDPSDEYRAKGGAAATLIRIPLSGTDFALAEYTFDDTFDGSADPDLKNFSIHKAPKTIRTIKDVLKVNGHIKVFAAPWSQPAWMKMEQVSSVGAGEAR